MQVDHPAKKARKRIKFECLQCGSQFDDDWKKKHEEKCHKGMRVQVKVVGAPSNPFVASVRRKKSQPAVNTETNQNLSVSLYFMLCSYNLISTENSFSFSF